MILTFDQFLQYYKKYNKFPEGLYNNLNKKLNEKQLQSKYEKYVETIEHKQEKHKQDIQKQIERNRNKIIEVDEKWEEVKEFVWQRDNGKCQYYESLSVEEKIVAYKLLKQNKHMDKLSIAHIKGRGESPEKKYMVENLTLINWIWHFAIDNYLHPLTGLPISKEERNNIWIQIIGIDRWNFLNEK